MFCTFAARSKLSLIDFLNLKQKHGKCLTFILTCFRTFRMREVTLLEISLSPVCLKKWLVDTGLMALLPEEWPTLSHTHVHTRTHTQGRTQIYLLVSPRVPTAKTGSRLGSRRHRGDGTAKGWRRPRPHLSTPILYTANNGTLPIHRDGFLLLKYFTQCSPHPPNDFEV